MQKCTPNAKWEIRKILFFDKHTPLGYKTIRARHFLWIISSVKEHINTRDELKRKGFVTNLENDWLIK